MCFVFLDKCKHSDDEDKLCVFAKNINEKITHCKLIYPIYSTNTDVEILPKCFNKMKWREQASWGSKLEKAKPPEE